MQFLLRLARRALLGLMIAAIVLWAADWAVFAVRSARGHGYDQVQVEEFLSTPLKGDKTEYDYIGTATMSCARALFPRGGMEPCWWLKKHRTVWE